MKQPDKKVFGQKMGWRALMMMPAGAVMAWMYAAKHVIPLLSLGAAVVGVKYAWHLFTDRIIELDSERLVARNHIPSLMPRHEFHLSDIKSAALKNVSGIVLKHQSPTLVLHFKNERREEIPLFGMSHHDMRRLEKELGKHVEIFTLNLKDLM